VTVIPFELEAIPELLGYTDNLISWHPLTIKLGGGMTAFVTARAENERIPVITAEELCKCSKAYILTVYPFSYRRGHKF
jgi:hypothetical protein